MSTSISVAFCDATTDLARSMFPHNFYHPFFCAIYFSIGFDTDLVGHHLRIDSAQNSCISIVRVNSVTKLSGKWINKQEHCGSSGVSCFSTLELAQTFQHSKKLSVSKYA